MSPLLRQAVRGTAAATPPVPAPTKLCEFTIRMGAATGRAPPAGCDRFYYGGGSFVYSGGTGVSAAAFNPPQAPAARSGDNGPGNVAHGNLADTRLDAFERFSGVSDGIKLLGLPPGPVAIHASWAEAGFPYSAGLTVFASDGTTVLATSGPVNVATGFAADASGVSRPIASFFALEQPLIVTVPANGVIAFAPNGGDFSALPINWLAVFTA